jgi:hypothetical protein
MKNKLIFQDHVNVVLLWKFCLGPVKHAQNQGKFRFTEHK